MSTERFWLLAVVAVLFAGCFGEPEIPGDPKAQLKAYVTKSFAVKSPEDKAGLVEYLTGDSRRRLEAWSDDQFREAFMGTKRKFLTLSIRDTKVVSPKEVSITYEVSYMNEIKPQDGKKVGKEHNARITHRKSAQLVSENGRWFIADVRNIKELVEYQDEMTLP